MAPLGWGFWGAGSYPHPNHPPKGEGILGSEGKGICWLSGNFLLPFHLVPFGSIWLHLALGMGVGMALFGAEMGRIFPFSFHLVPFFRGFGAFWDGGLGCFWRGGKPGDAPPSP